ncbi:MAG TPA: glycosyltransferase family 2 protein, partial [Pirellulales bacterium]|nr:glycosyltransferase family 2 protein [Pirellulales bacterium]
MNPRPTLSVIIIAQNEEQNLPGLLATLTWPDEIVLVDGGSTDATVDIARSHGARVHARPFDDFCRQQNHALALARGDWVLSLDADERPTPALVEEIRRRLPGCRENSFRTRIRSSIFGRRVRFSGTQDDRQVRLARRRRAHWAGEVHETLQAPGPVGQLQHWLDHDPLPDLAAFLTKMHRYTVLAAGARLAAGMPPRRRDAWLAPMREIFRRLVWKQGIADGPEGWAFCLLSGLSEWVLADTHRRLWAEEGGRGDVSIADYGLRITDWRRQSFVLGP